MPHTIERHLTCFQTTKLQPKLGKRVTPDYLNNSTGPDKHLFSGYVCLRGAATETRDRFTDLDSKRASEICRVRRCNQVVVEVELSVVLFGEGAG